MFGHLRFYYPPLQITVRTLCQAHAISKNGSVCENGSEASIFNFFCFLEKLNFRAKNSQSCTSSNVDFWRENGSEASIFNYFDSEKKN